MTSTSADLTNRRLTDDDSLRLILAQERANQAAGKWHADLVAPLTVCIYDASGAIVATLDDTNADNKRSPVTLLRQATIMAGAWERHLSLFGDILSVEVLAEQGATT